MIDRGQEELQTAWEGVDKGEEPSNKVSVKTFIDCLQFDLEFD